jgi:hypothetical protein
MRFAFYLFIYKKSSFFLHGSKIICNFAAFLYCACYAFVGVVVRKWG